MPRASWVQVLETTTGRLNSSELHGLIQQAEAARGPILGAYLCGPTGLMELAKETLLERGLPPQTIRQEFFSASSGSGVNSVAWLDGRCTEVSAGVSLQEALEQEGHMVESSCRTGNCGTCRLRLLEGSVHHTQVEGLTVEEEASGWILPCVAYAQSSLVRLSWS